MESVTVRVPATTANLGPGFDCLGMALALTQDVTVTLGHQTGPAAALARLTADAVRAAYRAAKVPAPLEVAVIGATSIPIGRGLGASAAARAAGILAANVFLDGALDAGAMLTLGANLEGHGDNMAPALFGGLRVVVHEDDGYRQLQAPLAPGLKVVLFIPEFEMPTSESRKVLPQSLSREDAVHNAGRAALLIAALARGEWDALDAATQDRLHQPARAEIFPALPHLLSVAKDSGALCAYLSGAGSTVAAFAIEHEERIARAMMQEGIARGYPGTTQITAPSDEGAHVVEER